MGSNVITRELVKCACGKGFLSLTVKVVQEGPLTYSVEEVAHCMVCGSTDLVTARAKPVLLTRRATDLH
jgi:hypothetical protein